jgi:SAM-dependent methyltransferase
MPSSTPSPYDPIANQWDAVRAEIRPREAAYLDLFVQGAAPGSTFLDLGCGTGRPNAVHLASKGFRVVGVDQSCALLEIARRYVPGGRWIEADIVTLELEEQFAGVIAWDSLFHIERTLHRAILEKIHRWLLPGRRFVLTCGGSDFDIPAFTDTMFDHTFFYDAFPKNEMIALIREIGFDIVLAELIDFPDGGRNKGKLGVVASKPSGIE